MTSEDDNLSSWARYLKNKYGSKTKKSGSGRGDNGNTTNEQVNNQVNRNNQQKQSLLMTFGSRGSQPGLFTWPRGIAVNPTDNSVVVADSSNHRVQVFNEQAKLYIPSTAMILSSSIYSAVVKCYIFSSLDHCKNYYSH